MSEHILKNLWKISLGICSVFGSERDFDILTKYKNFWQKATKNKIKFSNELLYGILSTDSYYLTKAYNTAAKEFVCNKCQVFNDEDIEIRLNEYLSGSNITNLFNKKRHFLISLTPKEKSSFIDSLKEKNKYEYESFSLINQYDKSLPGAGMLAFDISNYTSLCRLGAFLGYLDENKAHEYLVKSARLAQKNYSSFYEFAVSSTVGILFCKYNIDKNYYNLQLERLNKLLTHPKSYFTNLDWNEKL
ncbi:DUF1266 domain-containing protein [Herbivorax sp. ANBcel31]|uniref:DUF1266 domain-containing protein n=1 Tax=Herbivorax sp. ANBcel31 TaxID=3069754 RepID=UPI0027B54DCA|nr:DUF1266 domain-containing protein [Herbivorax sp. ANBcel31]MDQ2085083.1 DUF1266 domain-containing protein [Herbivorax sp. ANBcel31]